MNNMINLIKLHYDSVIAVKKYNVLVMILAVLMLTFNKKGDMFPFSAGLILMILNYNSLAYEDKSKTDYLIHALPVKSNDYILSKYLFGIINIILTIVFVDCMFVLLKMLNIISMTDITILELNMSVLVIGAVVVNILVPIALIVGFNKARILLVCLAVAPICFTNVITSLISKNSIISISFYDEFYVSDTFVVAVSILAGIILTAGSYFITAKLYSKKDIQ